MHLFLELSPTRGHACFQRGKVAGGGELPFRELPLLPHHPPSLRYEPASRGCHRYCKRANRYLPPARSSSPVRGLSRRRDSCHSSLDEDESSRDRCSLSGQSSFLLPLSSDLKKIAADSEFSFQLFSDISVLRSCSAFVSKAEHWRARHPHSAPTSRPFLAFRAFF